MTSVGAGLRSDQESNIRIGITFINWFVSLLGLLDNTSVSVISLTALRDKARIQLSKERKAQEMIVSVAGLFLSAEAHKVLVCCGRVCQAEKL